MIRLFAALAIPTDIGVGLVQRQFGLPGARWRPIEAFHITLRFFGDLTETVAADLDEALGEIDGETLALHLDTVGAFGKGADIHAVWAGVAENPALRRLAKACELGARRAGLPLDSRRYTPHVTLAYLRNPEPGQVADWLETNSLLKSPGFQISQFGLYSSWQTSEGSRYRLEREYALRSAT
jgi:RNA 2',3'-cyclic 3'-phosphodiesterase